MNRDFPPISDVLLDELATAAWQGRLTWMFGAGISLDWPTCCPTWRTMVTEILRTLVPDFPEDAMRPHMELLFNEVFLQQLDRVLGRQAATDALRACLGAEHPNRLHRSAAWFLKHGYGRVLTTNFDEMIEVASQQLADESPLDHRRFLKLHGTLSDPTSARFTVDNVFAPLPPGVRAQAQDMLRQSVLVVGGYSGMDEFDVMPTLLNRELGTRVVWVHHEPELDPVVARHFRPFSDDKTSAIHADIATVLRALYHRLRRPSTSDPLLDEWPIPAEEQRNLDWFKVRIARWGESIRAGGCQADYLWGRLLDQLSMYHVPQRGAVRNLAAEVFESVARAPTATSSMRWDSRLRILHSRRTLGEPTAHELERLVREVAAAVRLGGVEDHSASISVLGRALHQWAVALQGERRYREAQRAFEEAIQFRRENQDPELSYSVFGQFMNACRAEEDGHGTLDDFAPPDWRTTLANWLEDQGRAFEQQHNAQDFGQTLHNAAFVYQRLSVEFEQLADYETASTLLGYAIRRYEQARQLRERLRDPRMIAQSRLRIAQCRLAYSRLQQWQGKLKSARTRLDEARDHCRAVQGIYRRLPQERFRLDHVNEVRRQIVLDRRHLLGRDLLEWRPRRPLLSSAVLDEEALHLTRRHRWRLGVLAAIFDDDLESVFFVQLNYLRERYGFFPWVIPGGAVEPGERPSHAAAREWLEETVRLEPSSAEWRTGHQELADRLVPAGWFPRPYFRLPNWPTSGELLLLFAARGAPTFPLAEGNDEIRIARRWQLKDWERVLHHPPDDASRPLLPHLYWALTARAVLRHGLHPLLHAYHQASDVRRPPWHDRRAHLFLDDHEARTGLRTFAEVIADELDSV